MTYDEALDIFAEDPTEENREKLFEVRDRELGITKDERLALVGE